MSQDNVNELISALLDGELAPEEQARVEELLLDSAEHRQTFKEMRALRDHIQALPTYTVGGDFANSVLRQIDRRKLAPENGSDAKVDSDQEPQERDASLLASRNGFDSSRGIKRGLAWAAMAIAASLLIFLIYGPLGQQPQREAADMRDTSRDSAPRQGASEDKSQLKDVDRAEPSQLAAKPFADSVEKELERNADSAEKASVQDPDTLRAPKDAVVLKESADQSLAAEAGKAGKADQSGLLPAGGFGGRADDSGAVDLYYVVDIPSDLVVSEIVAATLDENGIAMVDVQDQLAARRRTLGRSQFESPVDRFAGVDVRDSARELSLQNDKKGELKRDLDESGGAEILVLNATPQQINKTLASLKARGYQWEALQEMDGDTESLLEGKTQAGHEKQLGSAFRAVPESDEERSDAQAASRRTEAATAKVKAPEDAAKPGTSLEEDTKRKLPRATLPQAVAGGASSNRAASGPSTEEPSDVKNEVGKVTKPASSPTPPLSLTQSAGEETNDVRRRLSGSYGYQLKAPTKQDVSGVLAQEKDEESEAGPLPGRTATRDAAVRGRANKSKAQPQPNGGGEGASAQIVDGPELADANPAATEDAPVVRAIIILRSVPPTPKAEAH